ncbi:hypothetical protein [Streptomyces sp. NPDC005046]
MTRPIRDETKRRIRGLLAELSIEARREGHRDQRADRADGTAAL